MMRTVVYDAHLNNGFFFQFFSVQSKKIVRNITNNFIDCVYDRVGEQLVITLWIPRNGIKLKS